MNESNSPTVPSVGISGVKSFSLSSSDLYSHRLESGNVYSMQKGLILEDLVRKNGLCINSSIRAMQPEQNKSIKIKDLCLEKFGEIICNEDLKVSSDVSYLVFRESMLFSFSFSVDPSSNDIIRSMEMTVFSLDSKPLDEMIKYLHDLGFSECVPDESDVSVVYGFPSERGPRTVNKMFKKMSFNSVRKNYANKTQSEIDTLVSLLKDETLRSGIIILNGPVGTGKSFLIRALLSDISRRQSVILSPPEYFMSNIGMMHSVIADYTKSFVILEDLGEMLAIDSSVRNAGITSNLLNATSGLLSLLSDTIFILTFNHDIGKLDPAFLRPGRCIGKIEIGLLPFGYAQTLTKIKLKEGRSYSLAEIYEINRTGIDTFANTGLSLIGLKK